MNKEEFIEEVKKIIPRINDDKLEEILRKLEIYKDLLIEWNKKFNLTAITDDKEIYLKHFLDSIYLAKYINFNQNDFKVCDIGTGAGFPGMVLAIFFDKSVFTLVEANNKKITFLNEVKNKLSLNNVEIINERAEIYGKSHREQFDIITCRAVSHLSIISELAVSMLKINGLFVPMKSKVDDELLESKNKIINLGLNLKNRFEYNLPIENSVRNVLVFEKKKKTDLKYPRNYNIIKKDINKN